MRGIPKNYETKDDYINSLKLFPEETKQALQALIADRYMWKKGDKLSSVSDGVTDAAHIVLTEQETGSDGNPVTVYYQAEKVEDTNARLYRMGFTLAEAEELVK